MSQVIGLFPTPFMRVPSALDEKLIRTAADAVRKEKTTANTKTDLLSHTEMVNPNSNAIFIKISRTALPRVVEFGEIMFGETLRWTIKEMWYNVLETGGHQALHTHANTFVSGVVFLTDSHPSANTVFHKMMGGTEFNFTNNNKNSKMGPFNSNKWVMPDARAGDLILFPSYMLHAVPRNQGEQRITVAFNAVPDRLDSWGYRIGFV